MGQYLLDNLRIFDASNDLDGFPAFPTDLNIDIKWAPLISEFNQQYLNPYLNYHRPCFFPKTTLDAKGKQRKSYDYENLTTPYEKLKSLPNAAHYLKSGQSFEILDALAMQLSDNQAADQLNAARQTRFKTIHGRTLKTG